MTLNPPAVASVLPSGEKATAKTQPRWPRSVTGSWLAPPAIDHTLTRPSRLPLASFRPSGEKATE